MATPFIKKMYNALQRYDHDPAVGMRLVRQNVRTEADLLAKIKWPHCNEDAALVAALLDINKAIPLIAEWPRHGRIRYTYATGEYLSKFTSPHAMNALLYDSRHAPDLIDRWWAIYWLWYRQAAGDTSMLPMFFHLLWQPDMDMDNWSNLADALLGSYYFEQVCQRLTRLENIECLQAILESLQVCFSERRVHYLALLKDDPRPLVPPRYDGTIGTFAQDGIDRANAGWGDIQEDRDNYIFEINPIPIMHVALPIAVKHGDHRTRRNING